ncbi:MAG: RpiB/LacA/LacB family sugar-phosphate isomerase [Anaerolineaceae bacterium]|nr:RpiB/LacA/LacB family sugar-phosphate isomerase [Anaerolineaceae bacterium]
MRVAIACDHAGFTIKNTVIDAVKKAGHQPIDLGTDSTERVDFPDFAEKAGRAIIKGEAERGIVICGSGVGVCITINKMKGIYAGLISNTYSAHQGVEHDAMNVMCLGGLITGPALAQEMVKSFLDAEPINAGRYKVRVEKIKKIENEFFK